MAWSGPGTVVVNATAQMQQRLTSVWNVGGHQLMAQVFLRSTGNKFPFFPPAEYVICQAPNSFFTGTDFYALWQ
jgi:hypothetical protein